MVKWSVSDHGLPSGRFSTHSLRAGGATCLYHSGVDSEYIRRIGRWQSSTIDIYLHFDGKILRNLSTGVTKCERLTSQLKARADNPQKIMRSKKDGSTDVDRYKSSNRDSECNPPNLVETENRAGESGRNAIAFSRHRGRIRRLS